jgi:hypothetical protein
MMMMMIIMIIIITIKIITLNPGSHKFSQYEEHVT